MKFEILNRFTRAVQITAEIDCSPETHLSVKLGLAVRWAIKNKADLSSANLRSADLRLADLRSADLRSADLRLADLRSADLRSADLRSADLSSADLRSADLRLADLRSADLSSADLRSADLSSADLRETKGSELALALTRILPEGEIIGWKKCCDDVIVKLRIPADAKRSHAFGRKCRAEFVDVLEIFGGDVGISGHDNHTEYRVGQRVLPDGFDERWTEECASGIHFFITRLEAEAY